MLAATAAIAVELAATVLSAVGLAITAAIAVVLAATAVIAVVLAATAVIAVVLAATAAIAVVLAATAAIAVELAATAVIAVVLAAIRRDWPRDPSSTPQITKSSCIGRQQRFESGSIKHFSFDGIQHSHRANHWRQSNVLDHSHARQSPRCK
ncbi:MAG: hypothetical protein MZV65_39415 [Chromatiales bacterium]|nr:hypothetical protein [Chromatiales bacterium]